MFPLLNFVWPSLGSTLAFLAIVATVVACLIAGVHRAFADAARSLALRRTLQAALIVGGVLALSGALAQTGWLLSLAASGHLLVYPAVGNLLAVGLALSPLGARVARSVPLWVLVAFQAFRLPLELVLHSWHEQGSVPLQMTFEGENLDIVTGITALLVAFGLRAGKLGRGAAWGFNLLGLGLLVQVMQVAIHSTPGPFLSYLDEPPLLLMFYLPFTWILPICVSGALLGHLVTFRALMLAGPIP